MYLQISRCPLYIHDLVNKKPLELKSQTRGEGPEKEAPCVSGSSDQRQNRLVPVVVPTLLSAGAQVPPEHAQFAL